MNKYAVTSAQGIHSNIEADRYTGPDDNGNVYFWIGPECVALFRQPDSVRLYVPTKPKRED